MAAVVATAFAPLQVRAVPNTAAVQVPLPSQQQAVQPSQVSGSMPTYPQLDNDLYVLGPGDGLSLSFLDPTAAGVGGGIAILPDGTATLALLGSVQLTGLTIGQATRWLTSLYSKLLVRPQLFLTLTSPRPVRVSILGEVERPGWYPLPSFSTPVSAIQTAGGITLNADVRKVLLRRRLSGPDGAQKQTMLDLAELLQFGNQRQNPLLFDGDTLVVARTDKPLPDEVLQLAASNLTPATINVTVIGEVRSPGTISLRANTPLNEAILRAGGANTWRAKTGSIELVRLNRNGTSTREVFALNNNKGVSNGLNPPLRNNDTLIVKRTLYGEVTDVVNQVLVPIGTIGNVVNTYYYWSNYNNNNNNNR
jgi:polysaccharide biosynthesis/export protein